MTRPQTSPRTPARGAAGLRPPACGPPLPSLPVAGWAAGSGLWDIALHMGSRLSPAPCRRFPHHPRPLPPLFARPTCVELWVHLRLLFHIFSPAIRGLRQVAIGLVLVCTVIVLVPASLSPRHITPLRSPLARFLLRPMTLCAQSRTLQSMRRAPLLPLSLRSPYRRPPARKTGHDTTEPGSTTTDPPPQPTNGPHWEAGNEHPQKPQKKKGGGQRPRRPSHHPSLQAAPPPGRGRGGQPPRSRKGRHTGRGKLPGPVRDRLPHGRQLHTPAGETPADRRASGESQPGPRTAQPEQERRGTNEAPTHTCHSGTQPRRGRQRPNQQAGTDRNPWPRKVGRGRRPDFHTHQQPCSPRPNTRPPKPQPELARSRRNPYPLAHTASPDQGQKNAGGHQNPNTYQTQNPSQEKPGGDEP